MLPNNQFNKVVDLIEKAFEDGGFLFGKFQNTPICDIKSEYRYTRENVKDRLMEALNGEKAAAHLPNK